MRTAGSGSPDQPLIIGSVYNSENMPWFSLPVNKQLAAAKEKFKPAYAEQLARRRSLLGESAALAKRATGQEEANRKTLEELNRQAPPLDGNALGRALLKNLGLAG